MSTDSVLSARRRTRLLIGGMAGNFIEFLDFAMYGLVATIIAKTFFAEGDPTVALLSTFMVYATSFAVRPLGGVVLGRLGDRWGRKRVLALTVSGMCVSTALIGILPGYRVLGAGATALLVFCRIAQGFFAGGEFGSATSYITESASEKPRAYWASWSVASSYIGSATALLLFLLVSSVLPQSSFESWGWRLLFILSVPLGLVGTYIRHRLDESPEFLALQSRSEETNSKAPSVGAVVRGHWKQIIKFVLITASHSLPTYILTGFFVTYLIVYVELPTSEAASAVIVGKTLLIFTTIGAGWLNDRIGRKRSLIIGCLMLIPMMYVAFAIAHVGTLWSAIVATCLLALSFPLVSSAMAVGMVEMFPIDLRVTANSIGYNVGASLFGGTAPLIATFLIAETGNHYTVPTYVAIIALGSLVAGIFAYAPSPRSRGIGAPAETATTKSEVC
ncbi:MFS transporter [Streptomyces parvulus]|uniref:MFS transporter n=1 Tax=Streptomyces parvulus TaxID=146923 RepID=UPI003803EFF1